MGVPTTLSLALTNPGPDPLTVSQVTFQIAKFGMGVQWEALPPLGPFEMPGDSTHQEIVEQEWTPDTAGHRCVQASIQLEGAPTPIYARRNLEVIQSAADRGSWQVPFALGNPEQERLPVVLRVGGDEAQVRLRLLIRGRLVQPGEAIWLNAQEEVQAHLLLLGRTAGPIASEHTVEAFLDGHFLDGIKVVVQRAAIRQFLLEEDDGDPARVAVEQEAFARVR